MNRIPSVLAVLLLAALPAGAAPRQVTSSLGDSEVERFGPRKTGLVAVASTGDLTPGAPGNADGSREIWLLDLRRSSLTQITASTGDSSCSRILADGRTILGSRADLVPGENPDGSFEVWLYTPGAAGLAAITASLEDSFFQTMRSDGTGMYLVSKGDLVPGDPGNPDGRNEVYDVDLATHLFRQLTASPEESLARGDDPRGRFLVIQSRGDLTPGAPGNADGSWELFLLDRDDLSLSQITSSAGDSRYAGLSPDGAFIAVESTGDLVPTGPGNADGSLEVFLYDTRTGTLGQVTASAGDTGFAGFGPRSRRAAVVSRQDLTPGAPGNADGSREVWILDLRRGGLTQLTASSGDSDFAGFEPRKGKWAAILSTGDLTPGRPGNPDGSRELYFARLRKNPARTRLFQATSGDADVTRVRFGPRGRWVAFSSTADLVAGGNPDGSAEVFLERARRRPRPAQVTDSTADSHPGGFAPDARTLLIESRGDLDPAGPGNADGSLEIYRVTYR